MRTLLKSLLFGLIDISIIALVFYMAVNFKWNISLIYIFMVFGLIVYAIYLFIIVRAGERFVEREVEVVPEISEKLKPIEKAEISKHIVEKKEILPMPIVETGKEEAVNFNEMLDYVKYNLYYGHKKERIADRLRSAGWGINEINRAFMDVS